MKAVIMAGGAGTRLRPLTDSIPKPMIKILDKPVMEHIIELLSCHGITEIAVTVGHLSDRIKEYFGDGSRWNVSLTYFTEDAPLGTAGSVKGCSDFVSDDFIVISGDAFTDIDLTKAMQYHFAKDSIFTLVAKFEPNPVGLGVLRTDFNGIITDFIEKPSESAPALVNTGIYIINRYVLKLIPDGFYDFGRQLLPRLVGHIHAYVTYDFWSDIGTLQSYYYTNYLYACKKEQEAREAALG